jgi:serpin B
MADQFAGQNRTTQQQAGTPAATAPGEVRPVELTENAKTVRSGANALGMRLLPAARGEALGTVLSPLSLSQALGMAATGAKGETAEQMRRVLGTPDLDANAQREAHGNLLRHLRAVPEGGPALEIANSIWIDEGVAVEREFLEGCRNAFDAIADVRDLQAPETVPAINRWVAGKTREKITALLDSIHPQARLILVNAVYFRGDWASAFNPQRTKDEPFFVRGREAQPRPMMRIDGEFRTGTFDGVQVVELPYAGGSFVMRLVLPATPEGLPKLIEELTPERWEAWRNLEKRPGEVAIPKWTARSRMELAEALSGLGMPRAFTYDAEFGGISQERLAISRVIHEALVEVDEKGTEAAAATAVELIVTAVPERPAEPFTFVADRPFLWAIEHRESGAVLFLGAVDDPGSPRP